MLRVSSLCFLLACAGCGDGNDPASASMNPVAPSIVVDANWLAERLADSDLQLVDAREQSSFEESRIPGAIHVRPEQLAQAQGGVPSQVAPPAVAENVLGAAGLRNDVPVVVYGAPPEFDPARVVWALRYYGHGDVRYLDGGYAAWVQGGGEVDDAPPVVAPTNYEIGAVDAGMRVTSDFILNALGNPPYAMPAIQLVDARSAQEYEAGKIPTARLVPWSSNLDGGFLKSIDALRAIHGELDPPATTVTYCQTGWRGSVAWLVLEYLGYEDVRLYDGSWAQWDDGDLPVEP